jgi:hypothetical protein
MSTRIRVSVVAVAVAVIVGAAILATSSRATAPPVGPLPFGPSTTIETTAGQLIAFALPHRGGGRVWRIARPIDRSVLRQVSETDVGKQAVLVFVAAGPGTTTVSFGLTRGERFWAYESRLYTVSVQS